MARLQTERHKSQHVGRLRAAVLGANDGAISTTSLLVGVAAARCVTIPDMIRAVLALRTSPEDPAGRRSCVT
jgi:VIT1/CCC1 family predicted Fe2+/Mn2+ transporter